MKKLKLPGTFFPYTFWLGIISMYAWFLFFIIFLFKEHHILAIFCGLMTILTMLRLGKTLGKKLNEYNYGRNHKS